MYYFIVNPHSRSGQGKKIWNIVKDQLKKEHVEYSCHFTKYVGHATLLSEQLTKDAVPEAPVYLIVIGGDGTINEVLTGICDLNSVVFGFIPAGSGNDFCRGMHLPKDPLDALQVILHSGRTHSIDVPYLMDPDSNIHQRFGISTGIGYDAAVCQEINTSPLKGVLNKIHLGKIAYLFVALKQLLLLDLTPAVLTLDQDRTCRFDQVYFIAVMNQKYEGGGFKFCPKAKPDDGILDVIVVEGLSRLGVLFALPTAYMGRHTHHKGIHIYRCKSVSIRYDSENYIHLDGESTGLHRTLEAGIEDKKLQMILPSRR